MRANRFAILIPLTWAAAICGVLGALHLYMARPGPGVPAASRPVSWPSGALKWTDRPTLLVFIHPECPCTRATVTNLSRMLEGEPGAKSLEIVVVASGPAVTEETGSESVPEGLKQYRFERDPSGTIAAGFGVATSGHVILADAQGAIRFSGGVTLARGHVGTCASLRALERALAGPMRTDAAGAVEAYAVYGCPLFDASACTPESPACCETGESR